MSPHEFDQKFASRVKAERKITNEILSDILRAEDERFHLHLGFSSLFDWLTKGHGYSGSSAQRRIQAARLMRAVPELASKIEDGSTNMTVAAKAQSAFMQMEKIGQGVSTARKSEILIEREDKSTFEAERKLMEAFPELEKVPLRDTQTVVAKDRTRLGFEISDEALAILDRVKEILSHQIPDGSMNDILIHIGDYFLKREDPLRKKSPTQQEGQSQMVQPSAIDGVPQSPTAGAVNSCVKDVPRSVNRITIQESDDRCEYCDPVTGQRCGSRYQLQTDHIQMRAHGGNNNRENLRRLCQTHNLFMSEMKLGRTRANAWRNKTGKA